jgi:hypothetical protein
MAQCMWGPRCKWTKITAAPTSEWQRLGAGVACISQQRGLERAEALAQLDVLVVEAERLDGGLLQPLLVRPLDRQEQVVLLLDQAQLVSIGG